MTVRDIVILFVIVCCGCKVAEKGSKEIKHVVFTPITTALK